MPAFDRTSSSSFFAISLILLALAFAAASSGKTEWEAIPARRASIAKFGAVGDGKTLNTSAIQSAIDQLEKKGGGAVVIPKGIFLSGSIFLKPGVNLFLEEGAVLKGSTNIADYPKMKTRIEGHFEEWIPALVNADQCDHLRISGYGTLDGSGQAFYTAFLNARKANPKVTNLAVERPRLVLIQNCKDIGIRGIMFKNSGFWNLHLYRCQNAVVENVHFTVPENIRSPSTDGTDIDSCQYVTVRGCTFRVGDDCVCLKGSKGPFAMGDKDSLPVEHIRVENCTFERGGGMVTLGSEATVVRDVVAENCTVSGQVNLAVFKLRPDTPQHYEDIHYRNITLDGAGRIIDVRPWKQFFDLEGQPPPKSVVTNVTLSNIKGRDGSLGVVQGTTGQTEISDIALQNIDVQLKEGTLDADYVKNFNVENVTINGKPFSLPGIKGPVSTSSAAASDHSLN